MKKTNGFINKNDFFIAGFIILLAFFVFLLDFGGRETGVGRLVIAGEGGDFFWADIARLQRQKGFTKTFVGATGPITFKFDPAKGVCVLSASCPDKICMRMSYINAPPQMIVCLPGKIYAAVEPGEARGGLDAILR
jgi:hypothetical protein